MKKATAERDPEQNETPPRLGFPARCIIDLPEVDPAGRTLVRRLSRNHLLGAIRTPRRGPQGHVVRLAAIVISTGRIATLAPIRVPVACVHGSSLSCVDRSQRRRSV